MKECRFCGSLKLVKNGIVFRKQRYKCKTCGKNGREYKPKYLNDIKLKIIKSYLNGVGFRQIERIFDVPYQLVVYWIKKLNSKLEELKKSDKITEKEIIEILEADELFTYIKKNPNSTIRQKHSKESLQEYGQQ